MHNGAGNRGLFCYHTAMMQNWLADFCDSMRVFTVLVMTQLMVVIYALSFLQFNLEFLTRLSIISLLAQLVSITLIIVLCKGARWYNRAGVYWGVLLLVLTVALISSAYTLSIGWLDERIGIGLLSDPWLLSIKINAAAMITFLALIRYFYIQEQWQKQVRAVSRSQLNALQARIKPHFLFNSMNSIASLISIDVNKAETAVEALSDLFRRAFTHNGKHISLAEEIDWVKKYLYIEKLRLADKLHHELDVDDALLEQQIPVLCIQPLVENAVIHGIQQCENGGIIRLTAKRSGPGMVVTITNSCPAESHSRGHGTGLQNIRERLQLAYGQVASLQTARTEDLFTTVLSMPL